MPSIAITGGIACGKSTAFTFLTKTIPSFSYSSDKAVAELLKNDPEVKKELITLFGPSICNDQGLLDKNQLRSFLLKKTTHRKQLEAILHPRLKKQWQPHAKKALHKDSLFFIAEIPLLYEIPNLLVYFDFVIVIASSSEIQLKRLYEKRHLSSEEALAFLQLQLPLNEKITRANYVLWNDGSLFLFEQQLKRVVTSFQIKL